MHGRWLMNAAGDGFEIVDAEGKGITVAIPANDIEGMMAIVDAIDALLLFCFDEEVAFFVDGYEVLRCADVSLAIG
jgi:hypothetical protein